MDLTTGVHVVCRLVAPDRPPIACMPSEHLEVRPRRAFLDEVVLLVRLARVLPLAGLDHVDLAPCGAQRAHRSPHPKQDELSDVAEVEANAAAVGPAVLASLGPNDVGDVPKAPGLHDRHPVG